MKRNYKEFSKQNLPNILSPKFTPYCRLTEEQIGYINETTAPNYFYKVKINNDQEIDIKQPNSSHDEESVQEITYDLLSSNTGVNPKLIVRIKTVPFSLSVNNNISNQNLRSNEQKQVSNSINSKFNTFPVGFERTCFSIVKDLTIINNQNLNWGELQYDSKPILKLPNNLDSIKREKCFLDETNKNNKSYSTPQYMQKNQEKILPIENNSNYIGNKQEYLSFGNTIGNNPVNFQNKIPNNINSISYNPVFEFLHTSNPLTLTNSLNSILPNQNINNQVNESKVTNLFGNILSNDSILSNPIENPIQIQEKKTKPNLMFGNNQAKTEKIPEKKEESNKTANDNLMKKVSFAFIPNEKDKNKIQLNNAKQMKNETTTTQTITEAPKQQGNIPFLFHLSQNSNPQLNINENKGNSSSIFPNTKPVSQPINLNLKPIPIKNINPIKTNELGPNMNNSSIDSTSIFAKPIKTEEVPKNNLFKNNPFLTALTQVNKEIPKEKTLQDETKNKSQASPIHNPFLLNDETKDEIINPFKFTKIEGINQIITPNNGEIQAPQLSQNIFEEAKEEEKENENPEEEMPTGDNARLKQFEEQRKKAGIEEQKPKVNKEYESEIDIFEKFNELSTEKSKFIEIGNGKVSLEKNDESHLYKKMLVFRNEIKVMFSGILNKNSMAKKMEKAPNRAIIYNIIIIESPEESEQHPKYQLKNTKVRMAFKNENICKSFIEKFNSFVKE